MPQFLDTTVIIRFERNFRKLRTLGDAQIPAIAIGNFIEASVRQPIHTYVTVRNAF